MKVILFECVILCALFSVAVIIGRRKDPISGLHNMPLAIQRRVASLPEYRHVKILTAKQRIIKKLPALFVVFVVFCLLVRLAKASSFATGFLYAFSLWVIVKCYVVLVLDCLLLAHDPKMRIKGTEDMSAEYQNYAFYFSSIPRSLAAGAVVSVIIGMLMALLGS